MIVRIVFIAGTYQPELCGVVHYTMRLRTLLKEQGIESLVLTTRCAAKGQNNEVAGVTDGFGMRDLPALVRALHEGEADILHIQHAAGSYGFKRALFLLPLLLRLTGYRRPIVTTVHEYGWWQWEPPGIPPRLLKTLKSWGQRHEWWDEEDGFLLTLSDAIIAANPDVAAAIAQRLPRARKRLSTIPIAANIEAAPLAYSVARRMLCQRLGWPDDAVVLAFFGFLHPVKGLETLLAAFQELRQRYPRARLLLIGGVESLALRGEHAQHYRQQLETLIAEAGLCNAVHITGYLPDAEVSRWLSASNIGVLPFNHGISLKSGSLLTLLEHGLPVVATHHNPPEPLLEHTPAVRLVAPHDSASLTRALETLLNEPEAWPRLGALARTFAQDFSWQSIIQRHIDIYHAVLACQAFPNPLPPRRPRYILYQDRPR
jgi:glycosyltransferase involved in cell wall biosynthesis